MVLSEATGGCNARRGSQGMAGPLQEAQRGSAATGGLPSGQAQSGHPRNFPADHCNTNSSVLHRN